MTVKKNGQYCRSHYYKRVTFLAEYDGTVW